MSNSAANAAAKRRRGATQQPMSQSNQPNQPNQPIATPPTLTVLYYWLVNVFELNWFKLGALELIKLVWVVIFYSFLL